MLRNVKRLRLLMLSILLVSVVLTVSICAMMSWSVNGVLARVGVLQMLGYTKSVADRLEEFAEPVRLRLQPLVDDCGLQYPPTAMRLVALKQERVLELWLAGADNQFTCVQRYPILGASGHLGPKLREGDLQVPEGVYAIESLNPNSLFHLSLRLNYPSPFDQQMGKQDNRDKLGSDIMIHGNTASIGCLAMGDQVAEDLFVLGALVGCENVGVIIAPYDLRKNPATPLLGKPLAWYDDLCQQIRVALIPFTSAN